MYERRFAQASSILTVATRVATRGDSQLATRHWVAAVQAGAFAGLGDTGSCHRALDAAGQVRALSEPAASSGWLRFDGSRLTEERGTCCIELGQAGLAQTALTEALNLPISLRRRGSILTDLATPGIQRRELDQVLEYGDSAVKLAEQTQSAGYVGRKLQGLRTQLTPLLADDRVSQLTARISKHYPGEPKPGYVTPWDETPQWERQAAAAVYSQVHRHLRADRDGRIACRRWQRPYASADSGCHSARWQGEIRSGGWRHRVEQVPQVASVTSQPISTASVTSASSMSTTPAMASRARGPEGDR